MPTKRKEEMEAFASISSEKTTEPDFVNEIKAYIPLVWSAADFKKSDMAYAIWFVNTLYRKSRVRGKTTDNFCRISSESIRHIYPTRVWTRIREKLVADGVLEVDQSYQVGRVSKGYRLTPKYLNADCSVVTLTSTELLRKVAKQFPSENYAGILATAKRLTIEGERPRSPSDIGLESIAANDLWWTVCRYGRLHYPLTNMRRGCRKQLRLESEALWQVDTRNSQPLYLALMLRNWKQIHKRRRKRADPTNPPPPFVVPYVSEIQNDELQVISELASEGGLYSVISSATGVCESKVKPAVFGVLYGRSDPNTTEVGKFLAKSFPTFTRTILRLNRKNRGWLARHMQVAESKLVIGSAVAKFASARGYFPLTIHDSLVVKKDDVGAAEAALTSSFEDTYEITPPLRTESLLGECNQ